MIRDKWVVDCTGVARRSATAGQGGDRFPSCAPVRDASQQGFESRITTNAPRVGERGFTLAAMMVIMAVMAIFLTVAVETASFQTRREKEEELIFRGGQAVEAIRLFRARNGRFPVTLEELVTAHPRVLRKVWTDPMTGKTDWIPVFLGEGGVTIGGPGGGPGPTPTPGIGQSPTPTPGPGTPGQPGTGAVGPIVGVRSRVCDDSIKIWNGHTRYCEWKFIFDPARPFGAVLQPVPLPSPSRPK